MSDKKPLTEKEQIEIDFAKLLIQKFDDYTERLSGSKTVKDREYKNMANAIYGCKLVIQGVINEGEKYEVKLG